MGRRFFLRKGRGCRADKRRRKEPSRQRTAGQHSRGSEHFAPSDELRRGIEFHVECPPMSEFSSWSRALRGQSSTAPRSKKEMGLIGSVLIWLWAIFILYLFWQSSEIVYRARIPRPGIEGSVSVAESGLVIMKPGVIFNGDAYLKLLMASNNFADLIFAQ